MTNEQGVAESLWIPVILILEVSVAFYCVGERLDLLAIFTFQR